jgi:hypothetical protein
MPKSAKKKRLRDSYRFPGFHPWIDESHGKSSSLEHADVAREVPTV